MAGELKILNIYLTNLKSEEIINFHLTFLQILMLLAVERDVKPRNYELCKD